jgi:hypothetical protein
MLLRKSFLLPSLPILTAAFAQAAPNTASPAPPASSSDLAEIQAALSSDAASSSSAPAGAATSSEPRGAGAVQSLNPDISVIGDFAAAAFSRDGNHQTGGHDPIENGFNLQALELSFGASVDPYFRFDSHLAFGRDGFELEEAYGTTLDLPARLQARVGQFLSRFGRLNASHPHTWDFVDQPFALGRLFGEEGNRGVGAELSELLPLPWYVELVASVSRADGEGTARSFYGAENPGVKHLDELLYIGAIKQFFPLSDDWSLFFGMSAALGPNASGPHARSEIFGGDLYLKYRPITEQSYVSVALQSEWMYRRREIGADTLQDVNGYSQLVYRFAQRWSTAVRYELGTPSYDTSGHTVEDPLDPTWSSLRRRGSLALTFYPSEFSRLRLQGSRDSGPFPSVWAGFLAVELAVGAHGAHAF